MINIICITRLVKKTSYLDSCLDYVDDEGRVLRHCPKYIAGYTANNELIVPNSLRRHINLCLVLEQNKQREQQLVHSVASVLVT